jgi:predicted amidophosphoribosyltransferase
VRGAFAVTGNARGRHVAVIDDVLTTGATAREISRVLLRAGAENVEIWAIAHAG